MVDRILNQLTQLGAPDSPELTMAIQHIEQAKDAIGRALIHHVGKVNGVSFEDAVKKSVVAGESAHVAPMQITE